MAIQATYIQGVTIVAELTAEDLSAAVFKYWPVRDDAAHKAAQALLKSLKSSASMGELHVTDKTAAEISALEGILRSGEAAASGSVDLEADSDDDTAWSANVDSSAMFGAYEYVILATDANGVTTAAESGSFTVTGDPSAATGGGGPFNIHTRFC